MALNLIEPPEASSLLEDETICRVAIGFISSNSSNLGIRTDNGEKLLSGEQTNRVLLKMGAQATNNRSVAVFYRRDGNDQQSTVYPVSISILTTNLYREIKEWRLMREATNPQISFLTENAWF